RMDFAGRRTGIAPWVSVVWALVPLLTLGWGTGFSFTYAAVRLRSWALGAMAGVYFALGLASFLLVSSSNSENQWQGDLGAAIALTLIALGTAHAFAVRPR